MGKWLDINSTDDAPPDRYNRFARLQAVLPEIWRASLADYAKVAIIVLVVVDAARFLYEFVGPSILWVVGWIRMLVSLI